MAPLALVFLLFFVVPMLLVIVVSFFDYEAYDMLIPAFTLPELFDVFSEQVTWDTYLNTLKFCLIVWVITLVLGFTIAYFLAFYVRSLTWQMTLFLRLHHPVLDQQRHPHDLVDPAPRPQRARQLDAAVAGPRRPSRRNGCSTPTSR